MGRFARLLLILFTLFIVSCGDSNLLMTLSDSENAVIFRTSINSGDILNPDSDEEIDISIEYDENIVRLEKLEIAFLDFQGLEISEPQLIEGAKLNEPLPSISVASPDDSLYSIRLRVFDNDEILIKEEIIPFFYSRDLFLIRGIVAYPNTFVPGGQGLIFPDVKASVNSWVRWSIDNEIIEEGFLSEYVDGFIWKAPLLEGVYGLRMELFPVEPLYTTNGTFSFTSPLRSDIEIFVTKTTAPDPFDLFPRESYRTLIHFKGIIKDLGTSPHDIITIGTPVISKQGDKLGFYLDGKSGYLMDSNILPVINDLLMPFSVTFSYSLDEQQADSSFLSVTRNGGELFSIRTDSFGILSTELFYSGGRSTDLSDINPEDYNEITLSVVPGRDIVSFYWYGDGVLVSSGISDYNPGVPDLDFKSIIGGSDGFEGFIDEFGIYSQDAEGGNNIDDNIFERKVNRKYNSGKVIAAYGFDGLRFEDIHNPSLSVLSGSLVLDSGSVFRFLETDFNFSYLFIDIDFEQLSHGSEIQIHFSEESSEKIIHINPEDLTQVPFGSQTLEIELKIENGILTISHYGTIMAGTKVQVNQSAVFYIVNESESDTKISSLLVRREEKRVVEDLSSNSETKL